MNVCVLCTGMDGDLYRRIKAREDRENSLDLHGGASILGVLLSQSHALLLARNESGKSNVVRRDDVPIKKSTTKYQVPVP
jgi:hypothetical protein